MNRSTLHTAIGCLLALAFGAIAGSVRSRSSAPDRTAQRSAPQTSSAKSTDSESRTASAEVTRFDDTLAQRISAENGAKRWLLMLEAVENATREDMPGLMRIAGKDSAMIRMIAARWAELDPVHMFHWLYTDYLLPEGSPDALPSRSDVSSVLFEEWAKSDLPGMVKALTDVPSFGGRDSLRMNVANQVLKLDVEQGLRVMKEWNVRNYIPDMKKVGEWAARDPQHAAETVLKYVSDYAGRAAMKEVGKAWAKSNPQAGLQFAAVVADPMLRATLANEVIRGWAERDLAAAADFASGQSDHTFRASLGQGLVTIWAEIDPASALAWSQENLRGTGRTEVIGNLVQAAAEKNLHSAAELVAGMESGPAQSRACASIFETWFNKGKGERDAAFEWLAALPDAEARRAAVERVQWNWVWKEPDAVRDFITGPNGDLASKSMIHQVARSQASKNPEAAMQWTNNLSAERAAEARNAVLEQWLTVRPERAMEYARKLPIGAERERAIHTVSLNLLYQSPQQAAEWYRKLADADQRIMRDVFDQTKTSLSSERKQQLEQVMKKP